MYVDVPIVCYGIKVRVGRQHLRLEVGPHVHYTNLLLLYIAFTLEIFYYQIIRHIKWFFYQILPNTGYSDAFFINIHRVVIKISSNFISFFECYLYDSLSYSLYHILMSFNLVYIVNGCIRRSIKVSFGGERAIISRKYTEGISIKLFASNIGIGS